MTRIELEITGELNISFTGEFIAESSSYQHNGPNNTRYNTLTIYKKEDNTFILYNQYFTAWQGESCNFTYNQFKTLEEIKDHLISEDYNIQSHEKQLLKEARISITREI